MDALEPRRIRALAGERNLRLCAATLYACFGVVELLVGAATSRPPWPRAARRPAASVGARLAAL